MKFKSGALKLPIKVFIFTLIIVQSNSTIFSQELPLGYISYFSHKCNSKSLFKSWNSHYPAQWQISSFESKYVLEAIPDDSTLLSYVPESRAILSNLIFGDYILEFEFKSIEVTSSDSSGFYFLGPVKTSHNYYAFAFASDTLRFLFVDDSVAKEIDSKPVLLKEDEWNKIRIRRDILSRKLIFTINNNFSDQIGFSDRNLVMGYIGFGTQDANSYLKNINVWAPTAITDTSFIW